jgi:hypothetical protein
LGELTKVPHVDLRACLEGALGRSLVRFTPVDLPAQDAGLAYSFAHDTLREMAVQLLGYDLSRYLQCIDQWAESYWRDGWPEGTPHYLGRSYARLLAHAGDLSRLVRLVTDSARHEWMRTVTRTDANALAEIFDSQQQLLKVPEPDLVTLGRIAVECFRLSLRNAALPPDLPAVWVQLGQPERALSLAHRISDPYWQAQALIDVARAFATAGHPDRAEQVATRISDPHRQAQALIDVARALATAGHPDRATQAAQAAEQVATRISDPEQAKVLAQLAEMLAKQDTDAARSYSRRLVAKILVSNSWPSVTPLLGSLYPELITSLGTAMLDAFAPASTTK